ncbi:zinc finger protein 12-like [Planococcus citri]|uniref:zinc finger protein 12-like n=1 Tax=Planococcus citri TaxID=170843 RepID=UPI0031F8C01C
MKFYTCPMCCNAGFTNQQELKEHLQKASNPIDCPACLKSCKNVINLIKHLDQCAAFKSEDDQSSYRNSNSLNLNDRSQNSLLDDDDDDVEGYFCTVCDIKIPDVYKHIQQFHSGQEVILQDDDDDEVETLNQPQFYNSDKTDKSGGYDQKSNSSPNKREYKRKNSEEYNGKDSKEENHKNKKIKKKFKEEDLGEALYCVKCDISFSSVSEHMKTYHSSYEYITQDLSITDLFPESKTSNGSLAYNCSCCRKSFVRKTTLMKHLKLNVYKDTKHKPRKNCCRRKTVDEIKEETFDDSANFSGNNSGTDYDIDIEENSTMVKTEPEEDEEFEAATPVQNEATFPLEGINHIFNT